MRDRSRQKKHDTHHDRDRRGRQPASRFPDRHQANRQKERSREKQRQRQRSRQHIDNAKHKHEQKQTKSIAEIDRTQTCPFLVRIYYNINSPNQYKKQQDLPKDRLLYLHLWPNSKLTQIAELFRSLVPKVRSKQKYTFYRVFEENNRLVKQEIGTVMVTKKNLPVADRDLGLGEVGFGVGDFIDVTVMYV